MNCAHCGRQTFGRLAWCSVHGDQVDFGPTPYVCEPSDAIDYQVPDQKPRCVDCGKKISPGAARCHAHQNARGVTPRAARQATVVPRW